MHTRKKVPVKEEEENSGQQFQRELDQLCGVEEKNGKEEEECSGSGSSQESSKE